MKYPSIDINMLPDLDTISEPLIGNINEDILTIIATYFWENSSISSMIF